MRKIHLLTHMNQLGFCIRGRSEVGCDISKRTNFLMQESKEFAQHLRELEMNSQLSD